MSTRIKRTLKRLVLIAVAALLPSLVFAQSVILKVHHFLPPGSTAHKNFIVPWCDKVAKESGGKLKCQIYPAMQLGGTTMAKVETRSPGSPATCQPIRLTISMLGPGAICAKATVLAKSGLVMKPWRSTICRWNSGIRVLAPPMEKKADEMKMIKRPESASSSFMSASPPGSPAESKRTR